MPPKQTIDFLRAAEAYHKELAELYASEAEVAQRPEVRQLLAYMGRHEDILRHLIDDYEQGASAEIMDTWFMSSPETPGLGRPEAAGFRPDMSAGEVIEMALKLDEVLMKMYKVLISEAVNDELKDALHALLQEEEREDIRLLRSEFLS